MQVESKLHGAESKLLFHGTKRVWSLSHERFCCAFILILSCAIPTAPRCVEKRESFDDKYGAKTVYAGAVWSDYAEAPGGDGTAYALAL
jgi:hypothetical protein